ncbi:MAG: 50S ribosomal protein L9 [Candidatus Krumholzibacteria bacterium]|jgi:large subunit ribosomal protein L9|nr:50S ribosomal protein L9 [Candidatus Krumholzibacteria bacterium]
MEVIMLQTVENVGRIGQVVKVARGYARNYLLPKGLAVEASEGAKKMVAEKMVLEAKHDHRRKEAAEVLARDLAAKNLTVTIAAKVGDQDRLYGSVSARDIATALAAQTGFSCEHHQIGLDEPIKTVGEFEVPLKLHAEVHVNVKVRVQSEG